MVGYTTAPDVEVNIEEKMEALVDKKSSTGWMWKVLGAVLVVALCLAGVQLFICYWNGTPELLARSEQQKAPIPKDPAGTTDPYYTLQQISGNAKAAIHLVGTYKEGVSSQLVWRDNLGQAFTYGQFKLRENRIVVPQNGLYFVYSQASFRVTCGDEAVKDEPFISPSHRVWRYSESIGSKVSLMNAMRSVCQNGVQEGDVGDGIGWYNTIYLGAVFQLNKGDTLWTETNLLPELETDEGKTFFGVFAL